MGRSAKRQQRRAFQILVIRCRLEAQDWRCFYCQSTMNDKPHIPYVNEKGWTRDHVIPKFMQQTTYTVLACSPCNHRKGTAMPAPHVVIQAQHLHDKVSKLIHERTQNHLSKRSVPRREGYGSVGSGQTAGVSPGNNDEDTD